jgi:hypothetical protein
MDDGLSRFREAADRENAERPVVWSPLVAMADVRIARVNEGPPRRALGTAIAELLTIGVGFRGAPTRESRSPESMSSSAYFSCVR